MGECYYVREAKAIRTGNTKDINGLYGIVSSNKDLLLRVQLREELAKMYTECDSRHIEEVYLKFI